MSRCLPKGVGEPHACDVSVVGAGGGASVEVATGIAHGPVMWSANRSSVPFLRTVAGSAGTARFELVVARADGSGSSIVSEGFGEPTEFAWSPQGSQLAFVRRSGQDENAPRLEVVLTNADGPAPRSVTDATWWNVFALNWSSDGRRLAFQVVTNSDLAVRGYEIWTTDSTSGATGQLIKDACGLRYSPDGARIAYQAPCDELRGGVWVAAADGVRPIRLAERASSPTWRPTAAI